MNETEMIGFLEKMNDEDVPNFIGLLTQKKDFFFLHYYRLIEIKEKLEESFIDNYWHQVKTGKYTDDFVPQFNLSKADLFEFTNTKSVHDIYVKIWNYENGDSLEMDFHDCIGFDWKRFVEHTEENLNVEQLEQQISK
jgi:hypothetical protein